MVFAISNVRWLPDFLFGDKLSCSSCSIHAAIPKHGDLSLFCFGVLHAWLGAGWKGMSSSFLHRLSKLQDISISTSTSYVDEANIAALVSRKMYLQVSKKISWFNWLYPRIAETGKTSYTKRRWALNVIHSHNRFQTNNTIHDRSQNTWNHNHYHIVPYRQIIPIWTELTSHCLSWCLWWMVANV